MFERKIGPSLLEAVRQFPCVFLAGPRQSGKTTLLKMLFSDHRYISLADPDTLERLVSDPRFFFQYDHKVDYR